MRAGDDNADLKGVAGDALACQERRQLDRTPVEQRSLRRGQRRVGVERAALQIRDEVAQRPTTSPTAHLWSSVAPGFVAPPNARADFNGEAVRTGQPRAFPRACPLNARTG